MSHYERLDARTVPPAVRSLVDDEVQHFSAATGLPVAVSYWRTGSGQPAYGDLVVDAGATLNGFTTPEGEIGIVLYRNAPVSADIASTIRHELAHAGEIARGLPPDMVDHRSGVVCSTLARQVSAAKARPSAAW